MAENRNRKTNITLAVVDRGYRGVKKQVEIDVLLPEKSLKSDGDY